MAEAAVQGTILVEPGLYLSASPSLLQKVQLLRVFHNAAGPVSSSYWRGSKSHLPSWPASGWSSGTLPQQAKQAGETP